MAAPLFIISGPSGSGKTTLCNRLLKDMPELYRIITYTTRAPREGEINGTDYVFVSQEKFIQLNEQHQFLETNNYNQNWYGTHCELLDRLEGGQPCVVIPDINGAQCILTHVPTATTIWLDVSENLLVERLLNRGTENREMQAARVQEGMREREQMKKIGIYKHCVDTTNFETAYQQLRALVMC